MNTAAIIILSLGSERRIMPACNPKRFLWMKFLSPFSAESKQILAASHRWNLSDTTARPQLCLQLTRDSAQKGGVGFCDFQRAAIDQAREETN